MLHFDVLMGKHNQTCPATTPTAITILATFTWFCLPWIPAQWKLHLGWLPLAVWVYNQTHFHFHLTKTNTAILVSQDHIPFFFNTKFIVCLLVWGDNMISTKKLSRVARKWQKLAPLRHRRISLGGTNAWSCNTSPVADKGHFVVYTSDRIRFVVPLVYLDNVIFRELFQMAEEEFGLPGNGPIILPCDAVFMEYAVSLIQRHVAKDLEKAFLMSIAADRCSSSSYFHQDQSNPQLLICGFWSKSFFDFVNIQNSCSLYI